MIGRRVAGASVGLFSAMVAALTPMASQLAHFWEVTGKDPSRFMAVTDPGTSLAVTGRERGFRHVFENRPDIGGRYSALSHFGLVPAALYGVDGLDGSLPRESVTTELTLYWSDSLQ